MRRLLVATAFLAACSAFAPDVGPARTPDTDGGAARSDAAAPGDAGSSEAGLDGGPATYTVVVAPNGAHAFEPASLTIRPGDTVHWVWQATGHTVTSGASSADGLFCSPNDTDCANAPTSAAGATYDHTFTSAGTYPYFCRPHRPMMAGTIVVQ